MTTWIVLVDGEWVDEITGSTVNQLLLAKKKWLRDRKMSGAGVEFKRKEK